MCGLGYAVMRIVVAQGQERMDEEGCGAIYAAMRFGDPRMADFA